MRHGRSVPGRVLASLIRTGDAHSPRTADAAGQQVSFEDDSATHLPRCELTGATTDLHLIVYGEGPGIVAKLVATEPRFLLQKVTTLSMPLAALTLAVLATLEAMGKLPVGSPAARVLSWGRGRSAKLRRVAQKDAGVANARAPASAAIIRSAFRGNTYKSANVRRAC